MANTEIRLSIFFAAKDGKALYSRQKQDQEQITTQIMAHIMIEESGKITRPFRYNLNQIPNN